jgi:hypothetical protein
MNLSTDLIFDWVVAACVTATITLTISRALIFSPLRKFLSSRVPFLGDLVNCPYCLSHWVAFLIATIFYEHVRLYSSNYVVNLLIGAFTIIPLSAVFMAIIFKCIDTIGTND